MASDAHAWIAAAAAWGTAAAKALAQRRDADGPMLDRALELVRKFVAKRRLILFGGLAIDYALRLRGAAIYPDDERPDYDMLSPDSARDAYDLADELQRAGFANVGAIRALHPQTIRVRVDFRPVADLGYSPPDVYARLPTIEYRGLRAVHPDFQRIDMHRALCYPFNNAPAEDVFHRWRKDIKRFNMFEEHYPIAPADAVAGFSTASATFRWADDAVALAGFAAYGVLREQLANLLADLQADLPPALDVEFRDVGGAREVSAQFPDTVAFDVTVVGPDPESVLATGDGGPPFAWYTTYADVFPPYAKSSAQRAVAISSYGRLLAAKQVTHRGVTVWVASAQFICLNFLVWAHQSDGAARDTYRAYYAHTLALVRAAETAYDDFGASPFAPTVDTVGTTNIGPSYMLQVAAAAARLREEPPAVLGLRRHDGARAPFDGAALLAGLPANYYPAKARAHPHFDPTACLLFHLSGEKVTPR